MGVIGTLAVNVVANTGGLSKPVQHARAELHELAHEAPHLLAELTGLSAGFLGVAGGAIAAAMGLRGMIESANEFHAAMAQSTAIVVGLSEHEREAMEKTAHEVAFATKFSATEAAKAYYYLASAGLTAEQQLKALPVVATFAQAGMFDLARATELLADATAAMGLKVKDASQYMANMQRVADVLARASVLSNARIEQFAEALTNKAAASLRIVNKSIEEGVAVLAAFADQGIKGAEAGTALAIVMRELQTKALKNKESFASLGISVYDAAGKMNNMADIVSQLETVLGPLSAQGRKQTLLDLGFSDKSVAFVQMLVGTSDKIREYQAELEKAGGYTADVASKNIPAFEMALHKLRAAFDNLAANTAGPVMEAFGQAILYVTDVLTNFNDHQLANSIVQTGIFTGTFLTALFVFPKIASGIKSLVVALRSLAAGEALASALANPLYAGLALIAGVAAVAAVNVAFEGLTSSADGAEKQLQQTADSAKDAMHAIGDEADSEADGIETVSKKAAAAAERAAKKLADDAKHVADSVRTPAEIMAETVDHLNGLVEQGAISWEIYRRAVGKANDEMNQSLSHDHAHASSSNAAVTRGTSAAFSAIAQSRDEMARAARLQQQQLDAQKQANDWLKKIADQTKRDPVEIRVASI
jgi:TP901 family phage tail tape measure protein